MAGNAVATVDYWVELRPYLIWAWILVRPTSLGALAAGFIAARLPCGISGRFQRQRPSLAASPCSCRRFRPNR